MSEMVERVAAAIRDACNDCGVYDAEGDYSSPALDGMFERAAVAAILAMADEKTISAEWFARWWNEQQSRRSKEPTPARA